MPTLSAYIYRQTIKPIFAAIIIALLLLLVERLLRLLDLVLDSNGSLDALVKLLAFLVPHYLGLALPAAFFLGILLTFSRLQRDSELDALRASGIGLHKLLRPTFVMSLTVALLVALIFSYLQPHARYTYRALVYTLTHGPLNSYLQDGVFVELKGTTYMAEEIDPGNRSFRQVFAYKEEANGGSQTVSAGRGSLEPRAESDLSTLILDDARVLQLGPGTPEEASGQALTFNRFQLPVDLEQSKLFRPRGDDDRELTIPELWQKRFDPPPGATTAQLVAEFHDRIIRILSVFLLPVLAIPLSIGGRRGRRSYGLVLGLTALVVYNKVLDGGETLVSAGNTTPLLGQWLPFAVFALGSSVLFYRAAFKVEGNRLLDSLSGAINDAFAGLRRRFARRPTG